MCAVLCAFSYGDLVNRTDSWSLFRISAGFHLTPFSPLWCGRTVGSIVRDYPGVVDHWTAGMCGYITVCLRRIKVVLVFNRGLFLLPSYSSFAPQISGMTLKLVICRGSQMILLLWGILEKRMWRSTWVWLTAVCSSVSITIFTLIPLRQTRLWMISGRNNLLNLRSPLRYRTSSMWVFTCVISWVGTWMWTACTKNDKCISIFYGGWGTFDSGVSYYEHSMSFVKCHLLCCWVLGQQHPYKGYQQTRSNL